MTLARVSPAQRAGIPTSGRDALRRAVLLTLAYADLFDYPLTRGELRRYLIGGAASVGAVDEMLDEDPELGARVERSGAWLHLRGRAVLADVRRRRAETASGLWPVARRYGGAIAQLPLVRFVAVSGALAMDNAEPDADIDLFILVRPGRLWLCRLLVLGVVRLAALRGHRVCPNFLLSTDHLLLDERNLFTAHEVAQLVPVNPNRWYRAFVDSNRWVQEYLPNFRDGQHPAAQAQVPLIRLLTAALLGCRVFDPLERWEMQRKIRRLQARSRTEGGSVAFSADECRGHFAAHDVRVLAAFTARAAELAEVAA